MANLDSHVPTAHGIASAHPLPMALGPMGEEPKADPMLECGRERNRGHIALVIARRGLAARSDKVGPAPEEVLAIDGLNPTSRGRSGAIRPGRCAMTRPTKSLARESMRPSPKSPAVVWPLISLPATCPFSMRMMLSASVP